MLADFDPVEAYRRLLSRWLWVFAAGVLGALLGLLAANLQSPVLEASAIVGIGIDRGRAEIPDDITVLQAYDRVRALLLADDTLAEALSRAGSPETGGPAAFRERIRLAERPEGWELMVMAASADEAERLAQAWADTAVGRIEEASLHAIRAADWQRILYEASCSLVASELAGQPARWLCRSAPPAGTSEEIPASILAEVEASRGILPVFDYSLMKESRGSARLVVGDKGTYVLGGALVGLAGGTLAAVSRKRRTGQ